MRIWHSWNREQLDTVVCLIKKSSFLYLQGSCIKATVFWSLSAAPLSLLNCFLIISSPFNKFILYGKSPSFKYYSLYAVVPFNFIFIFSIFSPKASFCYTFWELFMMREIMKSKSFSARFLLCLETFKSPCCLLFCSISWFRRSADSFWLDSVSSCLFFNCIISFMSSNSF